MHLLVATAGVLPPESVADFAEMMAAETGIVTVMTVVQAPREFLEDLVTKEWLPFDDDPAPVRAPTSSEEAQIESYVTERGDRLVAPVVAALANRGIEARTVFVEADDVAATIVRTAEEIGAETIVMGATRQLFAESAWTSVSMQVTAESKLPVMLIPAPPKATTGAEDDYEYGKFTKPSSPEAES